MPLFSQRVEGIRQEEIGAYLLEEIDEALHVLAEELQKRPNLERAD